MIKIVDIMLIHENRILLVQQRKPVAYGLWSLPGGHVEDGESPEMAITREVTEELGITIDATRCRKIEHSAEDESGKDSLMVTTFVVQWTPQAIKLQDNELIGFGWFTPAELAALSASLRSSWIIELAERAIPQGNSA